MDENRRQAFEKRLSFVPVTDLEKPYSGAEVIAANWWIVDPDKGAIFCDRWSPQCNPNEGIARRLGAELYPGATIQYLPVAFLPRDITRRRARP